jgi:histidine triad (HIT) family protein
LRRNAPFPVKIRKNAGPSALQDEIFAPKTVSFLYTEAAMSCIFCKIVSGSIPSEAAFEDDLCYAFSDLHPQAPTHLLIVPREHIGSLADIEVVDRPLMGHLLWVAAELAREYELGKGYRVVANTGEDGGQTVEHLHLHLLGGRSLTWPPG